MYAEHDGLFDSGHIVSYVQRGESVRKTTADKHSLHLLLVWLKQQANGLSERPQRWQRAGTPGSQNLLALKCQPCV